MFEFEEKDIGFEFSEEPEVSFDTEAVDKPPKYQLFDYIKDVTQSKHNLLRTDPTAKVNITPFLLNRSLGNYPDLVLLANEMNLRPALPVGLVYDFYIYSIRKQTRYSKWGKDSRSTKTKKQIAAIQWFYSINSVRAGEYKRLLSESRLDTITKHYEYHTNATKQ